MPLATQCPACETVFRISTTQAAAKSGMVRCGICGFAFNALDVLVRVEDLDLAEEASEAGQSTTMPTAGDASTTVIDERIDDDVRAQLALDDAPAMAERDPGQQGGASSAHEPAIANVDEAIEPIEPVITTDVAESDTAPPTIREWWLPPDGELPEPAAPLQAPFDAIEARPADVPLADQRLDLAWPRVAEGTGPEFMRTLPAERAARSRAERITLVSLSLVAVIALAAQATWVWRDELATRWPVARPWLAEACARLGCRVGYPAHIDAITIESTNVQTNAPGSNLYALTGLLRNRDAIDLRYPYLALTLTDTQDQPVLRRVLRPEDYLPPSRQRSAFAAGSELPIRVTFELNELRFAGYRVERFNP